MKYIQFFFCVSLLVCIVACEKLDNYDEPAETLTGKVIDQVTGEPLITEQPNGYRIKLSEISWSENPEPEYFWGKADGTFNNTKLFAGTYEVSPVEGAFFDVSPQTVEIKGRVELEFKVIPYLSVATSGVELKGGNTLEVIYTISRSQTGDKILDSRVFVSTNPNVGTNILITDLSPLNNLSETPDEVVLETTYTEAITGLEKGQTYYVRVGARTDNPNKRYNFTPVTAVTIP
ncbi:MAG: DUF3823 domain-containing protein [Tannerellaceae bacterium]|nr:DUF3823 domain-containing protein [Tannerellaceae bacterium]